MDYRNRAIRAETLLHELAEWHALTKKPQANDYDVVRKIRRQGDRIWKEAEAYLALIEAASEVEEANEYVPPKEDIDGQEVIMGIDEARPGAERTEFFPDISIASPTIDPSMVNPAPPKGGPGRKKGKRK